MDLAVLEQEFLTASSGAQRAPLILPESMAPTVETPVSVWKEMATTSVNHVDLRALHDLTDMSSLSIGSPVKKKPIGLNIAAPSDAEPISMGVSSPIIQTTLPDSHHRKFMAPEVSFTQWEPSL